MSVSKRACEQKRGRVMRSAAFTDKVIAFSRTLRLRGKKERRNVTREEEARRRQKQIKTISETRQSKIKLEKTRSVGERCEKRGGIERRGCASMLKIFV